MFKGLNGNKNHFIVRKNIKIIWLFYTDEQPACCISPISKRALVELKLLKPQQYSQNIHLQAYIKGALSHKSICGLLQNDPESFE